jgi:uncharacterized protein (TIGR02145 family)
MRNTLQQITDTRDGQKYLIAKIGGKTWTAENLNYKTDSSWCYGNLESNCNKYGRLYNWKTAENVCPSGWRLPTDSEWENLVTMAGGQTIAGNNLRIGDLGFLALPGGFRNADGNFESAGANGNWWTATDRGASEAKTWGITYSESKMYNEHDWKSGGRSVRCIRDDERVKAETERTKQLKSQIEELLKQQFVLVKGGSFQMGCTMGDKKCEDEEKPVHSVTVRDFYIGKYEVTGKLWEAIMETNRSDYDNEPKTNISWNDVQMFIQKLNKTTGKKYRLPTEAEWEYAARGGTMSKGYVYSGSKKSKDVALYNNNSRGTSQVGTKLPNELGIYDMSGNVWEWVSDWYGDYSTDIQTNPVGPSSGSYRVKRGGSWSDYESSCRVSARGGNNPDFGDNNTGFRLAITP